MGPRRRHPQPAGDHRNPPAHQPYQRRPRPGQRRRTRRHRRGGHRDAPPPSHLPGHAGHPHHPTRHRPGGHAMTSTADTPDTPGNDERTTAMRQGRQADSARRHQRVIATLQRATNDGTEISASAISRAAGVDRSFIYRHRDLLAQIQAHQGTPPAAADGPAVTRASLHADLLAAGERATRLTSRIRQLETRLSETLGEQAWHESGLTVPSDINALNQKINHLQQQTVDLRLQLDERDQDLTAARATNRELMAQLNTCLLYTSPSPRDRQKSRMPSSA